MRMGEAEGGSKRLESAAVPGVHLMAIDRTRRLYRGDADLGGELAAAHWEDLEVRLAGEDQPASRPTP